MELIKPDDKAKAIRILVDENVPLNETAINDEGTETWVKKDDGRIVAFFTLEKRDGRANLIHYWISPERRGGPTFYGVAKKFRDRAKEMGAKYFIVNAPEKKPKVVDFLRRYLKVKEYGYKDKQYYFLSGVNHGKQIKFSTTTATNQC